nr:PucR family transcriptional regulator ligand-binding domain-containing protein [Corynebacterium xerosis]
MTLTVASLVDRPDLGLTLLAARDVAEFTPVDWAHAIDRADTGRWIARGTLVLTSGFQLPDEEVGQAAYVDALRRAGACAVAVDTGGRWDRVPAAIVVRGAEIGFPVLAVDAGAPFTTVVRAVAEEVTAIRERRLTELVGVQSDLVRMMLRGGVPPVLERLDSVIGGRTLVLNNRGTVLESAGGARMIRSARFRMSRPRRIRHRWASRLCSSGACG